jgi:hypothetical protein
LVTQLMATCLLNMEPEPHHSPDGEPGEYQWMSLGGYSNNGGQTNSPPVPDYNTYNYGSSNIMPIEPAPLYGMARPPPYNSHQQLQPLHPLIMPPQWPSMLTSQSSYSATTPQTASTTTPLSAASASPHSLRITPTTTTGGTNPRRTLTDDDRRRMCQYAEDNPGIKQTEIGCMFTFLHLVYSQLMICQ